MSQFVNLCKHFLGDDWRWGEAVIMHESNGNPYEIGDGGHAIGIMQQHADFQQDYKGKLTNPFLDKKYLNAPVTRFLNGCAEPAVQIYVFSVFWFAHADRSTKERIEAYNLGHFGEPNPEYLGKVLQQYQKIS